MISTQTPLLSMYHEWCPADFTAEHHSVITLIIVYGGVICKQEITGNRSQRVSLADELLCPVVTVGNIAHADLCKRGIENIGTVAFRIHPRIDNGLRSRLSHGDIFTGGTVGDAELLHHVKGRTIGRGLMAEIAFIMHIL